MKILITTDPEIPVPPKLYGGAERLASDLIDEYTKLGHKVYLLAGKNSHKIKAIKVFIWKGYSSVGFKNIIKNAFQLRKVYKDVNPDIVHCFSRLLYIYPLLFTNKKAVFVKRYGRFISKKSTNLAKLLAGKRLELVAAAKHMIKHLPEKKRWNIVYNFIDTNYYKDSKSKKKGLLFLGRIEDIKGVYEAIQVAIRTDETLTIAGNIEKEHQEYFNTKVKPYLNKKIKFIGPVNNEIKLKLFQNSMATLFPIKWEEPFGIVMAESMACGTPVIGFRKGSVPEVISDKKSGFVVKNTNEMIKAVKNIDSLNRKEVREFCLHNYSRNIAALKYIDLFNKLIKKNEKHSFSNNS